MPTDRVKAMVDALATGKVADANAAFADEMEDLVSTRMAEKQVEVASKMGAQVVDLDDPNYEAPELPDPHEVQDASQEAGEIELDPGESDDDDGL